MTKFSLTPEKLRGFPPVFLNELNNFLNTWEAFQGRRGIFEVVETIGVISIFTTSRSLQGKEVRARFDAELADLYHDLDMSFIPINFFFPGIPLAVNKRRDRAQQKIAAIYKKIVAERRRDYKTEAELGENDDMIWNLMRSKYKNGASVPDHEIAHILIGMLMAGQHTSSSIGAWILLHLAAHPDIQEELYQEQLRVLGPDLPPPTKESIGKLALHRYVIRETLRLHAPIHSIMRAAKTPLTFATGDPSSGQDRVYSIPKGRVLISSAGVTAQSSEYFPEPETWNPHRWASMADFMDGTEKTEELGYGPVSKSAASCYLPFGAGRHRCIGEQFAFSQLGTITCVLVQTFKFCNVAGKRGVPDTDYESMFTRPKVPAFLEWERRFSKSG
jgi:sterol 14alpha-demethylase